MDWEFINWAEEKLGGGAVIIKEPHGDQSVVYQITVPTGAYFLKIAPILIKEQERLEWLDGKLPVPKVVDFIHIGDKDVLLLSAVEGVDLAKLCKKWPAQKIVSKLADALRRFHTVDIKDCPFGEFGSEKVLIHGDACLPNFIFENDDFSGYVDLGEMRIDAPDADLSAAVWSLQYNLGKGYGRKFLQEYGLKNATDELAEKLRLQYEKVQKEWGLI